MKGVAQGVDRIPGHFPHLEKVTVLYPSIHSDGVQKFDQSSLTIWDAFSYIAAGAAHTSFSVNFFLLPDFDHDARFHLVMIIRNIAPNICGSFWLTFNSVLHNI
jgi:hypothetical protein